MCIYICVCVCFFFGVVYLNPHPILESGCLLSTGLNLALFYNWVLIECGVC